MLGVYTLYAMRKLKTPFVLEGLAFGVSALALGVLVSVPSVLANMFNSSDSLRYFVMAFSNTNFIVQMILIIGFATITKTVITFSHLSHRRLA